MGDNPKRVKATNKILALMKAFDEATRTNDKRDIPNFNEKYWKERLTKMSDKEFDTFMKDLNVQKENLTIDINMTGKSDDDLNKFYDIADKFGVKLREHVFLPHLNPNNPDNPVITSTPVPVIYVAIRKLQQMLDKKNTASADVDSYNPITGQVTGESKSASISDAQTFALTATNQIASIKEFLGPRADDFDAKLKMMRDIEKNGSVKLKDLNMRAKNKQSLQTTDIFLRGAGFVTDILKDPPPPEVIGHNVKK